MENFFTQRFVQAWPSGLGQWWSPLEGFKSCVDVALGDRGQWWPGQRLEWLDSMLLEGFSSPNNSVIPQVQPHLISCVDLLFLALFPMVQLVYRAYACTLWSFLPQSLLQ